MTNPTTMNRGWPRRDPVDAESEWEAFLSSKKQAMNRMKAGRQDALRRLGSDKSGGRSIVSEVSDEREAPGSYHKENYSFSGRKDLRDAPEGNRANPATDSNSRPELDMRKLIEIFTVIKKRRWNDLLDLLEIYPRSASIPCPKNIQSTAKGNLMLHEVCRNNPPLRVISALIYEYADAVKAKGGKGYLPVHYACATNSSPDVVRKLLDTFPASIRMRDTNDLMIPLHFACKWGASSKVIEILTGAYPEGRQVRDIYAKTPVDYANELSGEDRGTVLRTLEKSYHSRSHRSLARSVAGSEASIGDAISEASEHMQRELQTTKAKLDKVTSELDQRERKFSLQYGAEQTKASELQQQKDLLEQECLNARMLQDEQKDKINLLQEEVRTLKALQKTHNDKKNMLLEKIEALEQDKVNARKAISELDQESSAKLKKELTAALVEQEIKFKAMLQAEQRKIDNLEKQSREAELTHRHYTMALLQEHESEVSKFEELTSRFKILEGQLRREIENERTKRIEAQTESQGAEYRKAVEDEKEKVAFLESHITKVNDLLEAEQKRFIELEAILKETLAIENEQREEIEAEFREKESQYQSRIEIESQKREQLENAYSDIADKLKAEIEKTAGLQAYEIELKKELQMDQEKIEELQKLQDQSLKALERERARVEQMAETEQNSRLLLKTEELKVKELEEKVSEMQKLLDNERKSVKDLKDKLESLQALYEKELSKIAEVEEAERTARTRVQSLNEKVTKLEEEELAVRSKKEKEGSNLQATENEFNDLKTMLETEKKQVERLTKAQEELRDILNEEKDKVKTLEEPHDESEMDEMDSQADSQASSIEERLMEQQATLDHHKYRVTELEGKHAGLSKELEAGKESSNRLECTVNEKTAVLEEERTNFEVLLKEHGEIQLALSTERSKVLEAEEKAAAFGEQLYFEKETITEMQYMVDQAKIDFQSKLEEVASLEEEERVGRTALDASLKELTVTNDEVAELTGALEVEKEKVTEMAAALREVQDLVQDEKDRVAEYKRLLEAQKHLAIADQAKIRQLEHKIEEQLDALGVGKAENIKLERDLTATKCLLDEESKKVSELLSAGHNFEDDRASALLETEQNKVKALEHSCEQLMSLLDWEKKHVISLEEKQDELQEQADASSEELIATKTALDRSQRKLAQLSHELENIESMKKEIIRLTMVARQRDVMMAAMLYAIGDARAIRGKPSIQNAQMHVDGIESRVIGLELAGLDEDVFQDREARQLVAYNAAARSKTIRKIILPLVVAGGLVEYHHNDPTVLRELVSSVGQMSGEFRQSFSANLGEISHTLGDLSSSVGANLSANMGLLAASLKDSTILKESVAQVSGMATRRMNIRQV
ncbi:unnamed protein product [Pseudo-nitzschia multistriata]|uniref:Uncharacterized protein n=1 Tax=Pseudo-nitzschia multistriata TaxID=183589 RepID=A0A448YUE6_9STRA|nr:unnamed protein product [Pseudo-nitzschia multistriata]